MMKTISHLRSLSNSHSKIFSSPFSSKYQNQQRNTNRSNDEPERRNSDEPPKLFVVQPRFRCNTVLRTNLMEGLNLASSLQGSGCVKESDDDGDELPRYVVVQNPAGKSSKSHADTYFGPGTVDTVKCHLNALESEDGIDAVFVNTTLSGVQQRNLERAWARPVLDRVGLIIEIFNSHAQTKEAKLQAELAALMYKRTRLVRTRGSGGRLTFGESGESEVVSARGRASGGSGGGRGSGFISGAGETELQLQQRRIVERKTYLLSQIEAVRRTRALQRAGRRKRGGLQGQGLATVAIVGYTNAGKSTLVNALSHSKLYSDDRLFATVDPRLRSVLLPSGMKVLLSDTVGFISNLPVQLVEAFHATLEEVVEADLLVHVLDSSAENLEEQRSSVLEVLQQIGVSEEKLQHMIEVWNKIDVQIRKDDVDRSSGNIIEEAVVSMEGQEATIEADISSVQYANEEDILTGDPIDDPLNNLSEGKIVENQHSESVPQKLTIDVSPSKYQDITRVETSALMGVGLQELLSCIDEKLSTHRVLDRTSMNFYSGKWRPQTADFGIKIKS